MKNVPLLVGTIIATLAVVIAVAFMFSGEGSSQSPTVVDTARLTEGARHKQATDSAKITVVEFSDFQCPACRAAEPLVEQLLATYPDDVALYYRHFPLDQIHPNARAAARASEAAAAQEKFWEFHRELFANQEEWSDITSRDDLEQKFIEYAEVAEIEDVPAFVEALDNDEVAQAVALDANLASELGLSGTPTFFVEGVQVSAPQLLPTVEQLLQEGTEE